MKASIKDWLIVLVALLDDVAAIALVLLLLWYFRVDLPVWSMVVIGLMMGSFAFVVHRAVITSLHKKMVTGAEGMVGLVANVVEPLKPEGSVRVGDEYWKARSQGGDIAAGEAVEILAVNGLVLAVRRMGKGEE